MIIVCTRCETPRIIKRKCMFSDDVLRMSPCPVCLKEAKKEGEEQGSRHSEQWKETMIDYLKHLIEKAKQ